MHLQVLELIPEQGGGYVASTPASAIRLCLPQTPRYKGNVMIRRKSKPTEYSQAEALVTAGRSFPALKTYL